MNCPYFRVCIVAGKHQICDDLHREDKKKIVQQNEVHWNKYTLKRIVAQWIAFLGLTAENPYALIARTFCLHLYTARDGIFKLLRSPGNDSKESVPAVCVAWRALRRKPYS
jgi:hypothetical protein